MRTGTLLLTLLTACAGISSDPGRGEVLTRSDGATWLAETTNELFYIVQPASQTPYLVMYTSKLGGPSELIGSGGVIYPITANDRGVYWLQDMGGTTRMMAWTQGDTAPRELGTNPTFANGGTYRNIVTDDDAVYYADATGVVWKAPHTGTGLMSIGMTDTSAGSVALAGETLWVSTLHGVKPISLLAGGEGAEIVLGDRPDELAFDDNTLFVGFSGSGSDDGVIKRISSTGEIRLVASHLVLLNGLVASQGSLYFVTGNADSAVRRVPYSGGPTDAIAVSTWPGAVVVDDAFAYWTEPRAGEIRRTPR